MPTDWIWGSAGGGLIGLAGAMFLLLNGRIMGASGILGSLVDGSAGRQVPENLVFIATLVGVPLLSVWIWPGRATHLTPDIWAIIAGGVLVGLGTRLANGCTSGHGVCCDPCLCRGGRPRGRPHAACLGADLMARLVFAALAGGIFGLGLLISGMTDTTRVQGFLDFFGDWDPTLAFVMGGAILPMAVAWRIAARRDRAITGARMPHPGQGPIDARLIGGSVLFGAGWAVAGLCPGPAMASLGFGGTGGVIFLLAMVAGMLLAARIARAIDGVTAWTSDT
jgi:uncharacterized protein